MILRLLIRSVPAIAIALASCGGDPSDTEETTSDTGGFGGAGGSDLQDYQGTPRSTDSKAAPGCYPGCAPVSFTAVANVGNTPVCSTTYTGTIDNCYNPYNPPWPSILRNYVAPLNPGNYATYDDTGAIAYNLGPWQANKMVIPPTHRTSNDGRLALMSSSGSSGAGPMLGVFRPENMAYDMRSNATDTRRATLVPDLGIHPFIYFNPLDTTLPLRVRCQILHTPPTDVQDAAPNFRASYETIYCVPPNCPPNCVNGHVLSMPPGWHMNICDRSDSSFSSTNGRNPRSCQAAFSIGSPIAMGDCYDITLQANLSVPSDAMDSGSAPKWEIRTVNITAFVPKAKRVDAGDATYGAWIYPRQPANVSTLPPFDGIGVSPFTGSYNAHRFDWEHWYSAAKTCYVGGVPPTRDVNAPNWCKFFDEQRHTPAAAFSVDGDGDAADDPLPWDGIGDNGWALFEPTTTADGRLLLLNMMQPGVMYSYSSVACDASTWTTFKPLSRMPRDTAVQDKYEITRAQMLHDAAGNLLTDAASRASARLFRDTTGHEIPAGSPIPGAYMWIDRKGRNLVFSHASLQRDGYKARSAAGFCADPHDTTFETTCSDITGSLPAAPVPTHIFTADTADDKVMNPNQSSGMGHTVLGAWTKGKLVHLDNALNLSDFGGRTAHWKGDRYTYEMALYNRSVGSDPFPVTMRPRASSTVFSFENELNHYDALNPTLPFDVVWRIQGNGGVNAEIAFDDYIRSNALVVAHMNPAIDSRCGNAAGTNVKCSDYNPATHGALRFSAGLMLDGFISSAPGGDFWKSATDVGNARGDHFAVDPTLQNAATSDPYHDPGAVTPPDSLRLRGGARVEPLNAGGVLGRGVYLDGRNDIIDMAYPYQPGRTEWWLGVWLDGRDLSTLRTVFFFPDESSIAIRADGITVRDGARKAVGLPSDMTVPLQAGMIAVGKYFHLGVKITTESNARVLRFYIDGTQLASQISFPQSAGVAHGFQLMKWVQANGYTWFALGGCLSDWNPPFEGWVDELRVLELRPTELTNAAWLDEVVCNEALGTLVDVSVTADEVALPAAAQTQLTSLRSIASSHGYVHAGAPPNGAPTIAAVCEQLKLVPSGDMGEVPPQHAGNLLCAHRVHKNQDPLIAPRCVRASKLGQPALSPLVVRPSSSANQFCNSCHRVGSWLDGLTERALTTGLVWREQDARRQPLNVPAAITGWQFVNPYVSLTRLPGWTACGEDCTAMDRTFDVANSRWYFQ